MNRIDPKVRLAVIAACAGALVWLFIDVAVTAIFGNRFLFHHGLVAWIICAASMWVVLPRHAPKLVHFLSTPRDERRPPLTVTEDGGWTTIRAEPPPVHFGIYVRAWIMAAIIAAVVGWDFGHTAAGWVCFFLFGLFFSALFRGLTIRHRKVQDNWFSVSVEGVRLSNGKSIPLARIYAIVIRNASSGQVVQGGSMVAGSGAAGVLAVGMQSSYAAIQATNVATARKVASMSFTVELEHDGLSTVLAGGLTDALAHAVQAEICKRLPGFSR